MQSNDKIARLVIGTGGRAASHSSHPEIPSAPGAYLVEFQLASDRRLTIGKLGTADFPAGAYLYQGSARGPGGLRARLLRHLGAEIAHPHWHIDHLHLVARPAACGWLADWPGAKPPAALECLWSQALAALPGVGLPLCGFGASDCRRGCKAHLVHFQRPPYDQTILSLESVQAALSTVLAGANLR